MVVIAQLKREIQPQNMPQNNQFAPSAGSSLIQLMIPESPVMLLTKTLKLNGKFRLNQGASTFATPVFPNNLARKGGAAYTARLNERTGINSCFQNITLSGLSSGGQTLESVRNVGRLLATTNMLTKEQGEFDGFMNGRDPLIASRENISAVDVNTEVFFSIPLETGMIQGMDQIPIGKNGTRGLQVLIQLDNDSNVIIGSTAGGQTGNENLFYSLVDVSLSYDVLQFDAKDTEMMERPGTGQLEYNSWSHQYSVINASDTQINLNFGTRNTLAVISNVIGTTDINDVLTDGFSTNNIRNTTAGAYDTDVILNSVQFGKDGSKIPLDFRLDTEEQSIDNRPRVELIDALKGAMDVRQSARTSISVNTENGILTQLNLDGVEVATLDAAVSVQTQSKPVFGFGINTDNISAVGRDYSNSTYSVRLESTLSGSAPNSVDTYCLSKNVLTFSPQGISVRS